MAFSTTSLSEEIAYILMNIEQYEFEDVKQIQVIFTELHNNFTDLVDEALYPKRNEIVRCLIEKYQSPGMATFIGIFIRYFTKTSVRAVFSSRCTETN